jgi:superfamily II DNA or RNA helicase
MTGLDVLRPFTSHNAQHRGWEYVDRVRVADADATSISAEVFGTIPYSTRMRIRDRELRVWCTCPYFSDQGGICKHVWATAVVAEEEGHFVQLPDDTRLAMDFDAVEGHYEFLQPPGRQQKRPEWMTALSAVTTQETTELPVESGESQYLYVISAPTDATVTELPLHIERRDRKRTGEWAKPQASRLTLDDIPRVPDPEDRWALSLLYGMSSYPRSASRYGPGFGTQHLPTVYLKSSVLELLLPRLAPTGRVILRTVPALASPFASGSAKASGDTLAENTALAWDTGEPWRFALAITTEDRDASHKVDGVMIRGDRRVNISRFSLVTDSLAVLDSVASRFDPAGGFRWATYFRTRGSFVVPANATRALVESLAHSPIQHVELPKDLQWEERVVEPQFRITIGKPSLHTNMCPVSTTVEYEHSSAKLESGSRLLSSDGAVMYRRDLGEERAAAAKLKGLGVTNFPGGPKAPFRVSPEPVIQARKVPTLVHTLVADGWRVEAEGVRYRRIDAPKLRIKSGIDWFEIAASETDDTGTSVDLPDLVKAISQGRRTVTLGDGTIGMLPEEWLARVAPLLALGDAEGGAVRFKTSQVALIDALLAEQPEVDWDEGFARARAQLLRFEGVHAEDPPPSFRGELREYQRESLGWMRFLRDFGFGGCLADDMGLGKTVMVLAMLESRRAERAQNSEPQRPSLIVLPRSLLFNWMSEAERFGPKLRVLDFAHADRHSGVDAIPSSDMVLTTYGTLRRDVAEWKDHRFDYVVLDEAQAIKNAGTATAKAVRLLKADHRLALTGTPVENHLGELYSLFDFLNPGLLGHQKSRRPKEDQQLATLARGLRPFILRRTKEQVAPELPPRTEETLYCELEGDQRKIYLDLRDHYRRVLLGKIDRDGIARSKIQILEALLRLRQAACHLALLPNGGPGRSRDLNGAGSAKFDLLLPRLDELREEGRKALVFSQFTSLLALLRKELDASKTTYEYLDGATRDRGERVERFQQDPNCQLFLISLKAGGTGLNLTAAEYVFLLDPWWNPAVETQAIDRTHRIGQTKPVFAYRLVAKETVEERILELQSQKRALADAILDESGGGLRGLQREDVEQLLS